MVRKVTRQLIITLHADRFSIYHSLAVSNLESKYASVQSDDPVLPTEYGKSGDVYKEPPSHTQMSGLLKFAVLN